MSRKMLMGAILGALSMTVIFAVLLLLFGPGLLESAPADLAAHDHSAARETKDDTEYWTCTMHPSVKMKTPGKCPICGMDLIPVGGPTSAAEPSAQSAEPSVFQVDPRRRQLLNVQISQVEVRPLQKNIRTVAVLELDETRVQHVHTKIKGWIQDVYVDQTLQHVHKGDPLFSIYSPELVASQEEYLLALRTAETLSSSSFEHVSNGARSILESARRRLQLFDVTEDQIRTLEKSGEPQKYLIVYSPVSGHVMQKNAFANMFVSPEVNLYTIADHTSIWAQVEIYESDIAYVRAGQSVKMTTVAYPGEVFSGRIAYVYPHLNKNTRTMRVRLEFSNRDLKLKPEMYANVEINVPLGRHVSVPESAVLRTGKRDIVFVDRGSGQMQLREVELGTRASDYYQVLSGLETGEAVVTSANFLIDAESRVQGVQSSWETPQPRQHHH